MDFVLAAGCRPREEEASDGVIERLPEATVFLASGLAFILVGFICTPRVDLVSLLTDTIAPNKTQGAEVSPAAWLVGWPHLMVSDSPCFQSSCAVCLGNLDLRQQC